MIQKTETALIPAVAYIRMSTSKQEDSPERQRGEINRLASRDGYKILRWYEDHGLTGTEGLNRPEFQRLLSDAEGGDFDAILMYEQSRFSRQDIFEVMPYWGQLNKAGVRLITCQNGEIEFGDLGGLLSAIVGQHGARSESVTFAKRTVSGRRAKIEKGVFFGKSAFGYDRIIKDHSGKVIDRVHASRKFERSHDQISELVPSSDRKAVEAIQYAFQAILDGFRIIDVVKEFHRRGLKTARGNRFRFEGVKRILQSPTYAGRLVFGRYSNGKFARIDDDGIIVKENCHEAIVSPEVFDQVQVILSENKQEHAKTAPGTYLLSGLVRCKQCGSKCYGSHGGGKTNQRYKRYFCCKPTNTLCKSPSVLSSRLEKAVLKRIKSHLLSDENLERCWLSTNAQPVSTPQSENVAEKSLALKQQIEAAERNLILAANAADFSIISNQLEQWRKEFRELERKKLRKTPIDKEGVPSLKVLTKCRDAIESADRILLTSALKTVIECVKLIKYRGGMHKATSAQLVFKADVYEGAPIEIPSTELMRETMWFQRAKWVIEQNRVVSGVEIGKHFGVSEGAANYSMNCAMREGMIQKVDPYGWASDDLDINQTHWKEIATWIKKRKKPTTAKEVADRFELSHSKAILRIKLAVENEKLRKYDHTQWVDFNSELRPVDYEDVAKFVIEKGIPCNGEQIKKHLSLSKGQLLLRANKAIEKGLIRKYGTLYWVDANYEFEAATFEAVVSWIAEQNRICKFGEIFERFPDLSEHTAMHWLRRARKEKLIKYSALHGYAGPNFPMPNFTAEKVFDWMKSEPESIQVTDISTAFGVSISASARMIRKLRRIGKLSNCGDGSYLPKIE